MGCCIKLLLMCLTHWSRTRITSWKNGRSGYEAAMGWCDTRRGQFIDIIANAGRIDDFGINLYCAFVEKTTVMGRRKMIVSLLDGTEVECEME